jgi:hypothetical protein
VLKVMIACTFRANWRPSLWYDGRDQVQIPRGAFVTSYAKMAEFCNLSVKQIRSAFEHLEKLRFMACSRAQRWTLVTVLNYELYQCSADQEGTTEGSIRAGRGQDDGRQRATDEEVKNINTYSGAAAPLKLVSDEPNRKASKPAANRKPYSDVLERVARSIHSRHPKGPDPTRSRRDCSVGRVEKQLAAILKFKRVADGDAEACLVRIDRIHAAACESETWQREEGKYVNGLKNYLAPTEERYDVEAEPRKQPVRLWA